MTNHIPRSPPSKNWLKYKKTLLNQEEKTTINNKSKLNKMSKKITPANNAANTQNPNRGTSGVNRQYAQSQGNRGKQLNPNQSTTKKS